MPGLQKTLGLWVEDTSTVDGHLHDVQNLGFQYLIVRIVYHPNGAGGDTVAYQPDTLKSILADAATIDFPVYAWAYVYPQNIDGQVAAITAALPAGCANLVLDAEIEWENVEGSADFADQLAHGIAEATNHQTALHLSSFYAPQLHPTLPWVNFLNHCESFMPQTYRYGATTADTVITRTLAQDPDLAKGSLGGLLVPTSNQPDILQEICANAATFAGANVWLWDGSGGDPGVSGNGDAWSAAIQAFSNAYP